METIFALSSGAPPSGVAVIRISGPRTQFVVETMCGDLPLARVASLRKINHPETGEMLDEGVCLWFPGPASFTGEDSGELQVHGGPAVVRAVLEALGGLADVRMAEAGEFSRRAFENGRIDLTEVEGLADLIVAQTEAQRRQAVAQAGGVLRERLEGWRERIVGLRALVEAGFDFAEEEDVPKDVGADVWAKAVELAAEVRQRLDDGRCGEIVREGFQVVLMGPPNAGKSSLLNALAGREAAIVTDEAGTTRDLIEVHLDLEGWAVTVVDTAGMREAEGVVEREGMRRARERAGQADLVIWLWPVDEGAADGLPDDINGPVLVLRSKDDAGRFGKQGISVRGKDGLDGLLGELRVRLSARLGGDEWSGVSRTRHRDHLERCAACLDEAGRGEALAPELRAELLRRAGDWIGRLTGRIEADDLLDVIFREFCVGK